MTNLAALAVHHIDRNPRNNSPANLRIVRITSRPGAVSGATSAVKSALTEARKSKPLGDGE